MDEKVYKRGTLCLSGEQNGQEDRRTRGSARLDQICADERTAALLKALLM